MTSQADIEKCLRALRDILRVYRESPRGQAIVRATTAAGKAIKGLRGQP